MLGTACVSSQVVDVQRASLSQVKEKRMEQTKPTNATQEDTKNAVENKLKRESEFVENVSKVAIGVLAWVTLMVHAASSFEKPAFNSGLFQTTVLIGVERG